MTIVPQRDLGAIGVVTDPDPYDLPINAFSMGVNVRFENNKIERGPVFRRVGPIANTPKIITTYQDALGNDKAIYAAENGKVFDWSATAETDRSPASWTPSSPNIPTTSVTVQNIIYVNRADHVPFYRSKDSTGLFATLPSGTGQWDSTWRCAALRELRGALVAINVTMGATNYPTRVLVSEFADNDAVPATWDYEATTNNVYKNDLGVGDAWVDGHVLRDRMMLYSTKETWFLEFIGGASLYRADRIFNQGVINANCVIEDNGIHYVFGNNDIWMHDGITKKSISTGKVRGFIYKNLRRDETPLFFVKHNQKLNEVMFCFVSNDQYCAFPYTAGTRIGCNRAAVYNYVAGTWYFYDLPYVTAGADGQPSQGEPWDTSTLTWATAGGGWAAQTALTNPNIVFGGYAYTDDALPGYVRSLETFDATEAVGALDTPATADPYIERIGFDLDELKAELRGYKVASSLYPQIRLSPTSGTFTFTIGSSDHPSEAPVWGLPQTFDSNEYKLDHNVAGRYLHLKATYDSARSFSFTGIDYDLKILGSR